MADHRLTEEDTKQLLQIYRLALCGPSQVACKESADKLVGFGLAIRTGGGGYVLSSKGVRVALDIEIGVVK